METLKNTTVLRMLNRGELLTQEELDYIADNYVLTNHAKEKVEERLRTITKKSIKHLIKNCMMAYYNTDGFVNIAINNYKYFVVNPYTCGIITFKEPSHNGYTTTDKLNMARAGIMR